jgi:formate-dependent nitrite reductase cytochrome c552 subunit
VTGPFHWVESDENRSSHQSGRGGGPTRNHVPSASWTSVRACTRKLVSHPVGCIDCHAPDTMRLRVTRPGFIEGIRALKASQGVKDFDVNTMATRQELRTYVCGQCHVEYYFKGPEKRLVYPWANGVKVDDILA